MDPSLLPIIEAMIPIVAIIFVFSLPAVLFLGSKFFKLKEKELALDAEGRRHAEQHHQALEQRVQRLEAVLLALDSDLRSKASLPLQNAPPDADRSRFMEGPPAPEGLLPGEPGKGQKVR
jgi:hypothetical protein